MLRNPARVVLVLSAAACGRLGYDPHAGRTDGGEAGTDGADLIPGLDGSGPGDAAMPVSPVRVYWADTTNDRVRTRPIAGGSATTLVTGSAGIDDVCVDATTGHLYWGDAAGHIGRVRLDGTEPNEFLTIPGAAIDSIVCDARNAFLYASDDVNDQIVRIRLDNGAYEQLLTGWGRLMGIALDANAEFLYAADVDDNQLLRIAVSTGATQVFLGSLAGPLDVDFDPVNDRVYWLARAAGTVDSAAPDGTDVRSVSVTGQYPSGLAVDGVNGKIYWSTEYSPEASVRRANLDGSAAETLVTEAGTGPDGVALGP
jgi:DNA-binding beta-propeller fold protein YncE